MIIYPIPGLFSVLKKTKYRGEKNEKELSEGACVFFVRCYRNGEFFLSETAGSGNSSVVQCIIR